MLKNILKFAVKGLTPESLIASVLSKIAIGGAKQIYKSRKEAKRRKEIEEKINYYSERGIIQTLIMYLIGFIACKYIISWGIAGIILVLLGYYGHFQNLKEAGKYINVTREMILSIVSLIGLIAVFFILK